MRWRGEFGGDARRRRLAPGAVVIVHARGALRARRAALDRRTGRRVFERRRERVVALDAEIVDAGRAARLTRLRIAAPDAAGRGSAIAARVASGAALLGVGAGGHRQRRAGARAAVRTRPRRIAPFAAVLRARSARLEKRRAALLSGSESQKQRCQRQHESPSPMYAAFRRAQHHAQNQSKRRERQHA